MFKQKERDQQEIAQDVLMREVSEDLRAQQLKEFWAKYGKLIYSLVLLIIISTVAFEGYKTWRMNVRLNESDIYEQAVLYSAGGQTEKALAEYAKLENAHTDYKYLAQLRIAGVFFEQDKNEQALSILDQLRQDKSVPEELRAIAAFGFVSRQIDTADPSKLQLVLNPYLTPGNAWYGSAAELSALLFMREGKKAAALKLLTDARSNGTIPEQVKQRLEVLQTILEK